MSQLRPPFRSRDTFASALSIDRGRFQEQRQLRRHWPYTVVRVQWQLTMKGSSAPRLLPLFHTPSIPFPLSPARFALTLCCRCVASVSSELLLSAPSHATSSGSTPPAPANGRTQNTHPCDPHLSPHTVLPLKVLLRRRPSPLHSCPPPSLCFIFCARDPLLPSPLNLEMPSTFDRVLHRSRSLLLRWVLSGTSTVVAFQRLCGQFLFCF